MIENSVVKSTRFEVFTNMVHEFCFFIQNCSKDSLHCKAIRRTR